jgi:hypothetical protein
MYLLLHVMGNLSLVILLFIHLKQSMSFHVMRKWMGNPHWLSFCHLTISTNQCVFMSKWRNVFAFLSHVEMMENLPLAILSTLSLLPFYLLYQIPNLQILNLNSITFQFIIEPWIYSHLGRWHKISIMNIKLKQRKQKWW